MLYLTATDENTGALRILGGSHRGEYHHRLSSLQASHPMLTADPAWPAATFGEAGAALPAHIFAAEPCDAILFSQSCYHAVYGHQPNRTYIALKFAARPRTDEELACLQNRGAYAFQPHAALESHANPAVRQMVAGLRDLAGAAQAALARDNAFAEQEGWSVDMGHGAQPESSSLGESSFAQPEPESEPQPEPEAQTAAPAMRRLERLGRHLDRGPRAEPSASTTMIEGQVVVTAELWGDGTGQPPEHETQRLVDTLLNGAGFFIAR